jgi:gluconolactonase
MVTARLLAAVACSLVACSGDPPQNPAVDAAVVVDTLAIDAPPVNPLDGIGTVELVQGGYQFTEGPQWRQAQGDLLFSDIPANTIYRYTPGGGAPVVHRMPSGNSNGIALDGNGAVITAQHGTRTVARDGTAIASTFEGNMLNSPNDVIVHADGTIYFTDPPYGLQGGQNASALGFMGVFRLQTSGTLTAEHRGALAERPNGIGIAPDGNTLYVADTATGTLWRFARAADGSLMPRVALAMTAGGGDGLAIDTAGNIFVTTVAGIEVFAPSGTKWGTITVPMQPANCAFGDADHQTLYITARTALYKVRLANAGLPRH